LRFYQTFSKMTDTGAGVRGGSAAQSGMRVSVGMARGSVGWARTIEPRGGTHTGM
jgi:hypothetical protein